MPEYIPPLDQWRETVRNAEVARDEATCESDRDLWALLVDVFRDLIAKFETGNF